MVNKTRNFKSKEAYRKWSAYGHIHELFEGTPGNMDIKIKGRVHKVQHSK